MPPVAPARTAEPADGDALVFRVDRIDHQLPGGSQADVPPRYSVYADGRLLSPGIVPAIYPGPALVRVQAVRLTPGEVQALVERALAAGVSGTTDLGIPRRAVAVTTRFALTTADGTWVREAHGLSHYWAPPGAHPRDGLTDEQRAGRAALAALVPYLEDVEQRAFGTSAPPEEYEPTALAVLARPWVEPRSRVSQPVLDWPGPALPGEPLDGSADVGCAVVTGAQTPVVLAAARSGNAATPWRTADGALWAVIFRPLLPDETGCADLLR